MMNEQQTHRPAVTSDSPPEALSVIDRKSDAEGLDRDFCAREYDRIATALLENESMGEGRVSLYLGVWSAAVAGVGTIVSSGNPVGQPLVAVVLVGLAVLLALGAVTALRILNRNHRTDELIDSLIRLRHLLRPRYRDDRIPAALPWDDDKEFTKKRREPVFDAGLLQVVCLANAAVPALALLALRQGAIVTVQVVVVVVVVVVAALILQLCYASRANRKAWTARRDRGKRFSDALGCKGA